jgi:hypothetical protein
MTWVASAFIAVFLIGIACGRYWGSRLHERWVLDNIDEVEAKLAAKKALASEIIGQRDKIEQEKGILPPMLEDAVFRTKAGRPVASRKTWDDRIAKQTQGAVTEIPYDELEGMFLDQFLLRYFHSLMSQYVHLERWKSSPWDNFISHYEWAKEMPWLFEQMTGYKLNEHQLNNAIAEYARRLQRQAHAGKPSLLNVEMEQSRGAATPGPRENEYTGI